MEKSVQIPETLMCDVNTDTGKCEDCGRSYIQGTRLEVCPKRDRRGHSVLLSTEVCHRIGMVGPSAGICDYCHQAAEPIAVCPARDRRGMAAKRARDIASKFAVTDAVSLDTNRRIYELQQGFERESKDGSAWAEVERRFNLLANYLGYDPLAKTAARLVDRVKALEDRMPVIEAGIQKRLNDLEQLFPTGIRPNPTGPAPVVPLTDLKNPEYRRAVMQEVERSSLLLKNPKYDQPHGDDFPIIMFFLDRQNRLCMSPFTAIPQDGVSSPWAPARSLMKFIDPFLAHSPMNQPGGATPENEKAAAKFQAGNCIHCGIAVGGSALMRFVPVMAHKVCLHCFLSMRTEFDKLAARS